MFKKQRVVGPKSRTRLPESMGRVENTPRFGGRSILQRTEDRPNSRERARQKVDYHVVGKDKGQSKHSPGSKENVVDVEESPEPKKRKSDYHDERRFQSTSISSESGSSTQSAHERNENQSHDLPSNENFNEGCPFSQQNTEEITPSAETRREERTKEKSPGPPVPNKALEYYQQRLGGDSQIEPCSGTIKKVRLFNFMCHESFEKEWNPNLNFITGENGSGKSAILSGIIIGLGARANTTSRTTAVKGLVKTGKEFAKTEITLVNHGCLQDDIYGNEIIIQRVIDRKGTSIYKIHDGIYPRFRPLRRKELDCILLSLGIMIDNPVAVLNQETARSFLKTKNPKDKYQFFFDGTSLSRMNQLQNETAADIKDIEKNFVDGKKRITDLKDEVTRLEKLKEKLDDAERMEEIIEKLTIEYFWSLVIAEEAKANELKQNVEQESKALEKLDEAQKKLTMKKTEMINRVGSRPEDVEVLKTQLRNGGKQEQDAQRAMGLLVRESNESKGKVRAAAQQVATLKRTVENLNSKIEELSVSGKAEAEIAKTEYQEKRAHLQEQKEKYEHEVHTLKNDREQFRQGTESLRTQLNDLQDKQREAKHRLVKLKDEINNINNKSSRLNKYSGFGRPMEELMAKIQANQHKFKVLPRGPLGACFTVKNEKWIRLIELILNNQLFDFVVENTADQLLLNQLIKQTFLRGPTNTNEQSRRRPAVICNTAAFKKSFDVSRTKATTRNQPTIFDVLDIDNNDSAVLNTLIDSCVIERILLFDTNKDACEILKDRGHPEFPRNCQLGFSLEFYQITPDPRYRLEAKSVAQRSAYLKCSSAAHLRHLKLTINEVELELQELLPLLDGKRNEEGIFRKEYNNQEEELSRVQRKLAEIKMSLQTHSKNTIKTPDIASFVEELNETTVQLTAAEQQKTEAMVTLRRIEPQLAELKTQRVEVQSNNEALQKKIQELSDLNDHFQEKIEEIDQSIRKLKSQLRDVQTRYNAIKTKLEAVELSVQEKLQAAEEKGERLDTARSSNALHVEVQEYATRVEEAKRIAGNRAKIMTDLDAATGILKKGTTEYRCWYETFRLLSNYVNMTSNYYNKLVQVIGSVLTGCFQSLISSRGYNGRLFIDHSLKELYYFVCPDGDANDKTKDALKSNNNKIVKHFLSEYASGLSGGERSFATICFIVSMWQIMECPFFMLDEFDVFMDPFNRKASQNALISHAYRYKNHQFFLFTPLELTEMEQLGKATILRMYPPVRHDIGDEAAGSDETNDEDEPRRRKRKKAPAPSTSCLNRKTRR